MEISTVNPSIRAADIPLERLATSKEVPKQEKIAEVSRQFEAVLLRQILVQAQKPLFKNALLASGGTTNAIYQDMVTQQLADNISQGGTFGFAKVLEKQLTAEYGGPKADLAKTDAATTVGTSGKAADEPMPAAEAAIRKYKSPAIQPGKRI